MDGLELNFLGDLAVVRDGAEQPLPPSRKTRALLAYLTLNERKFRRESLCELLWEIPDDPRGSLRWSLSKLRRLVNDDAHERILADRQYVRFDPSGVDIDVRALQALVENGLDEAPLEVLQRAAERYTGHFLEGLELSNFHDFHAWCVAEREQTNRAQARLLAELVERTRRDPAVALPHARRWVGLSPYDEQARAALIGILVALGRRDEAEQQYQLGSRMLKEAGAEPTGTLARALRHGTEEPAPPPADAPPASEAPAADVAVDATADRPVSAPGPFDSTGRPDGGALVGRDAELAQIEAAVTGAAGGGEARLILIRGEPGLGKTRLLQAAAEAARAANACVLESSAFESESFRPFALWLDGLRRSAPDVAAELFGGSEYDNRERLFAGLSDFVTRKSKQRPVALLFDDLQWCDESSAAALHYVARTNRRQPVVGIFAARESELRDNAAVQQSLQGLRHAGLLCEIRLAPLPDVVVRELIEARAPEVDSERLSRECGGNPLIAIELARAELAGDTGSSLEELVRERLARFDIDSAEVLRWAAVLAPRIEVATLERLTDLPSSQISRALEAAESQAMLMPADRGFRFSHDLVARSVYTEISPARRRMMHRRVAELLEQDTSVDLERAADLAHHAAQSGDPGLAARAMVSAGRLSLRFFANDEALSLARKGLNLVDKLSESERVCLTIDLHDVMLAAAPLDDWESAVTEYVSLAERALDHGALSHARRGYYMASHVRWMHGHWSGARDQILQSERVSRGASGKEHVLGMAEAARCLALLERDLTHADAMLMEAQALAERQHVVHHSIPAALAMLRYHENRLDEAEALLQEARMLAKSAGDRISEFQINEYLVMIEIERGDYAAAKVHCRSLLEIGTKLREGSEAPFARAMDAVCDYALGDEADALDAAFDELRTVDAKHRLAYALTRAAMLDVERGRCERAISRAGEALQHAETLERATDRLLAHVVLAEAHRAAGDLKSSEQHAAAARAFAPGDVAAWALARVAALDDKKS